jgi:hypothetical protein
MSHALDRSECAKEIVWRHRAWRIPNAVLQTPLHFLRMALQSNAAPDVSHEHTSTERRKTVCPPPICLLTLAHAGVYALVRRYEESGGILSTRSAPDQAL